MFAIMSQSGHKTYGIKEYIVDTDADIADLHIDDVPGSAALVADNGNLYILNCKHEWKLSGGNTSTDTGSNEDEIIQLKDQIKAFETSQAELQKLISELTAANQNLTQQVESLQRELGIIE